MTAPSNYFYDGQTRRYIGQFMRMISDFYVAFGADRNGNIAYQRVPVMYGDPSRQASTILRNNSENTVNAVPAMSVYVSNFQFDRTRLQDPSFTQTMQIRQRQFDPVTGTYTSNEGQNYSVERMMPAPWKLTLKLDIWTSNTKQKLQLLEQILTLFNPSLEIQSTDNYIDWTSLTVLNLKDVKWSSRTVPVGTDNPIDIATLSFTLPMWITPPAKIKKLGVVEQIIANVYNGAGDMIDAITNNDLLLGTRQKFTPYGYQVLLIDNKLQALRQQQVIDQPNESLTPPDSPTSNLLWHSVVGMYGTLRPGISMIALEQEDGTEVYGTVSYDPNDDRFLFFIVDEATVPANTLTAVDAVINPLFRDRKSVV